MAKFTLFPTTAIQPQGWLKRQLEIQADGLCGQLPEFWPDIADSAWIGGKQEGWERAPYWLDGYIPLAWQLNNEDMKQTASRYVDAILANQASDGWICPSGADRSHYDVWACFLVLKVLVVYYRATEDPRIESAVYRALQQLDRHLDSNTLFGWAQTRWYEGLVAIHWLKGRCDEPWLTALALKLRTMGTHWDHLVFSPDYPYREPCEKGRWSFLNHVVNNAMMIKGEELYSEIMGIPYDGRTAKQLYDTIMRYHGMATGIFSGDENLNGNDPMAGTELCAVAELMYSFEWLLSLTGDALWADRLEWLAYNAWPATFTADMSAHQYVQQVNQPSLKRHKVSPYSTNNEEAHLMGVEPHYGCCTSNFAQGWPKFVQSIFQKTDAGIAVCLLAPAELNTVVKGVPVRIRMDTRYPFGDQASLQVEVQSPVEFELLIRKPGEGFMRISQRFEGLQELPIPLTPEVRWIQRPNDRYVLTWGGLLFAQAIAYSATRQDKEEAKEKWWLNNWEYTPIEAPAVAFVSGHTPTIEFHDIGPFPFSQEMPPVSTRVRCRTEKGETMEIPFVPYGSTILRMTEMSAEP